MKCWVALKAKDKTFRRQGFVNTFEELAQKTAELSAQGCDAYFGCASFKDASSRKQGNALGCKSFWLDLDCGPKKDYPNAEAALTAVDAFADKLDLPLPLIVRSGMGIHAYWPLERAITAETWQPVAELLQQVCDTLRMKVDESRTRDVSSILRPPGTLNTKYEPPLPTAIDGDDYEPIGFEAFRDKLLQIPRQASNSLLVGASANILGSKPKGTALEAVVEGGRNNACAKFCGIEFAKGLSHEQVLANALIWNMKNQPPLEEEEVRQVVASIGRAEAEKPAPAPIIAAAATENPIPRPPMPEGFRYKPGGHMWAVVEEPNEDGTMGVSVVPMADFECFLISVCRNENRAEESLAFVGYHPHNGWNAFVISREDFDGQRWLSIMGKNCTNITNPKQYKLYVAKAAAMLKRENMDATRYSQFGWKEDYESFLIGNALIRRGGEAVYAYGDEKLEPRMQGMKLPKNGSRKEWTLAANRYYAPGFEAQGFGLLTGFGATLMTFVCGKTDGGAWLALHSQGSGYGKSNVLQAIASIWGEYDALAVSGADTENAKFNIITTARHLPVLEEEMGRIDPIKAANMVKRFVTGSEKNRSDRTGAVEYKDKRFQTIMISASNNSLADTIRLSGDQGAMARVVEIPMEVPTDKEEFKEFSKLGKIMLDNCGYAGREFIYALMQPGVLEWVKKNLDDAVNNYQKLLETSPKDRYVVFLMACNLIAAKVVNAAGILSFDEKRIMDWALEYSKTRVESHDADPPCELLNQFVTEHLMDCLVVDKAFSPKVPAVVLRLPQKLIVMRYERETQRLFISQNVLRDWLLKIGSHVNTIAKALEKEGVLVTRSKQVTLSAGTDLPGARTLVWEVDMTNPAVSGGLQLVGMQSEGAEQGKSLSF